MNVYYNPVNTLNARNSIDKYTLSLQTPNVVVYAEKI
jgi:hypothetical protein